MDENVNAMACLPTLNQQMQERFGGPHTQFVARCFWTQPSGAMVQVILVVSCTQLFICDESAFVIRVVALDRLLATYSRRLVGAEQELLLVIDGEHDLLLRGSLTCDGQPAKPLLPTLETLYAAHYPGAHLVVHRDCPAALRELAKLKPPPQYVAPLPQREELFERCPCWRQADIMDISSDEFVTRIRNMFIVYCPEKLPTVQEVCRRYNRRRRGALQYLVQRYGPEPTPEHAAAVQAVLERERRFADLVKPADKLEAAHGSAVPLSAILATQKESKFGDEQPLTFSTLLLSKRPSGGYGRIRLTLNPVPVLMPQTPFRMFKRRPSCQLLCVHGQESHVAEEPAELWYVCNEGHVLAFGVEKQFMQDVFGFTSGDRVLSTWGVTRGRWSTVVGVRDGVLWAHDDGEVGASALLGYNSKEELERYNGWMLGGHVTVAETRRLPYLKDDAVKEWLDIAPEVVFSRFGFYHGEVVESTLPCARPFSPGNLIVVVGVGVADGILYVAVKDPVNPAGVVGHSGATVVVPVEAKCQNNEDLVSRYGWTTTRESACLRSASDHR